MRATTFTKAEYDAIVAAVAYYELALEDLADEGEDTTKQMAAIESATKKIARAVV